MDFYNYLYNNYGEDNPIIVNDLIIEGMSKNNIRQNLYLLEKNHKIIRYTQGIYYIPRETIIGLSTISLDKVIERKYILNDENIYGYYTGLYLKNKLGITTQMVGIPEVITNNESSKRREIEISGRKVIVKKSKIFINNDNALILQFFDMFKYLNYEEVTKNMKVLIDYIKANFFTRDMVKEYLCLFSKNIIELIIRSGLIYEFA